MTNNSPSVFVFCALACEARPLIHAWQLKKVASKGGAFTLYASDEKIVVVTGIGKLAMAGAVGYALGLFADHHQPPVLLNLGIAGHRSYPVGAVCLAHKIVDIDSGRSFFPQLPFAVPCTTLALATHAKPHVSYVGDELYDMEAAGFYEMAVKFSTSELIHAVKVVSDNAETPIANIDASLVENWIGGQIPVIEGLLIQLSKMQQVLQAQDSTLYQQLLTQFHFSVTSALKLKTLIQRWHLLQGEKALIGPEANLRSAKELIAWIESRLDSTEFYL